jgi:hypothetical protein
MKTLKTKLAVNSGRGPLKIPIALTHNNPFAKNPTILGSQENGIEKSLGYTGHIWPSKQQLVESDGSIAGDT